MDDFARNGLTIDVQIKDDVTLPAYQSAITFNYLQPAKGGHRDVATDFGVMIGVLLGISQMFPFQMLIPVISQLLS